jgi:hypothetical protein
MDAQAREQFFDALLQEVVLFESYELGLSEMAELIHARNFAALEARAAFVTELGDAIGSLDARRDALYKVLLASCGLSEGANFYKFASFLPEKERDAAVSAYRALKIAALRAKARSAALGGLIARMRESYAAIVDELIPSRRARTYDRKGKRAEARHGPLVLNRSL